jgi:CTP:phosphocholine cytidylyltransferase-like protein
MLSTLAILRVDRTTVHTYEVQLVRSTNYYSLNAVGALLMTRHSNLHMMICNCHAMLKQNDYALRS